MLSVADGTCSFLLSLHSIQTSKLVVRDVGRTGRYWQNTYRQMLMQVTILISHSISPAHQYFSLHFILPKMSADSILNLWKVFNQFYLTSLLLYINISYVTFQKGCSPWTTYLELDRTAFGEGWFLEHDTIWCQHGLTGTCLCRFIL